MGHSSKVWIGWRAVLSGVRDAFERDINWSHVCSSDFPAKMELVVSSLGSNSNDDDGDGGGNDGGNNGGDGGDDCLSIFSASSQVSSGDV